MSDAKAKPTDNSKLDASVLLGHHSDDAHKAANKLRAEVHHDAPHQTRDAHDKTHDKPAAKPENIDWRAELKNATAEMKKLDQLKANDPASEQERKHLIKSIDLHFQKALPRVQADTSTADAQLLASVAKATHADKEFNDFKINGKPVDVNKVSMDQIHNAILNAPDEGTRKQLTRLGMLAEQRDVAKGKVDEHYWNTKAPMMAALDYADFLVKHKDGVSLDAKGKAFSAGQVLQSFMSPELYNSPQGKKLMQLSQDSMANRQNLLIPSEKNPMIAINEAKTEATDPNAMIAKLKHAVELSKDPYFNPDNIAKEIAKAKNDHSPEGPGKLANLEAFSHARAYAEASLGQGLVATGKNAEAVPHLLAAANDQAARESIRDNQGNPAYSQLLGLAMRGSGHDPVEAVQAYVKADAEQQAHYKNFQKLSEANDSEGAAREMKAALASADEALKNARAVKTDIGADNAKKIDEDFDALNKTLAQKAANKEPITPEEQNTLNTLGQLKQMQKAESYALFTKAALDTEANNHNTAVAEFAQLQKMDPDFVNAKENKETFDQMSQLAQKGAEYDNSAWYGKAWLLAKKHAGDAWEFAKSHEKLMAGALALGAAAAIEVGTAGLGTPAAIALGVAGGAMIGTASGAGLEYASGRNKNVLKGAADVLPYALGGAAIGAPAAAGIGAISIGGETAWGIAATRAVQGGLIAMPYSGWHAYNGLKTGEIKSYSGAAMDFASNELQWGVGGGLMKGATWSTRVVGGLLLAGGVAGSTYMDMNRRPLSTRIQSDSLTLPAANNGDAQSDQPDQ